MDLKIIGWTNYDSHYPSTTIAQEDLNDLLAIIANEIIDKGYMFSGQDHQNSDTGAPVFDNGTCFRASMRAWGILMAAAYPTVNDSETQYMDFYMSTPLDKKLPESSSIDVTPAVSNDFNVLLTPQDSEMISQSIQMDIPFMTTDKALNYMMDQIKEAIAKMEEETNDGEDNN